MADSDGGANFGPLAHHIDRFSEFDAKIDSAVDKVRNPALDHMFYALSSAADHSVIWHVVGGLKSVRAGSLAPARRLSKILGVESALTNGPIKALFKRPRPEGFDELVEGVDGTLPYGMRIPITSSFPSGHATAAFCAATVLSEDGNAVAWYCFAGLVASSRVYVRMHHASDVIGGAVLGLALGAVLRRVIR